MSVPPFEQAVIEAVLQAEFEDARAERDLRRARYILDAIEHHFGASASEQYASLLTDIERDIIYSNYIYESHVA